MKKQFIFLVLIVFVAGVFLWRYLEVDASDVTENAAIEGVKPLPSVVTNESQSSVAPHQVAVNQTVADGSLGNSADAEEVKSWFASRGNFNFLGADYLADYRTYDLDTLLRLSDSGDLKAMYVLSERADSFEGVRAIHWKAALYGSTQALIELGSINENNEGDLNKLSAERKKEKAIEAFAYYEVAQKRGDWWGNMSSGKSLADRYKIELSDVDNQKIADRAKIIYDDLQVKRTDKGLGEFDNSVPDAVIKFYENILNSQSAAANK